LATSLETALIEINTLRQRVDDLANKNDDLDREILSAVTQVTSNQNVLSEKVKNLGHEVGRLRDESKEQDRELWANIDALKTALNELTGKVNPLIQNNTTIRSIFIGVATATLGAAVTALFFFKGGK